MNTPSLAGYAPFSSCTRKRLSSRVFAPPISRPLLDRRGAARGGQGTGLVPGEKRRDRGQREIQRLAGLAAGAAGYRRQMPPCAGVGEQRARHLEIQRASEFLFGAREILAAIEDDAAIEVGLAARQIPGRGKRGAAGQIVIRQRRVLAGGEFLGARPQKQRVRAGGIGMDGGIQSKDGAGEISGQQARTAPIGERGSMLRPGPERLQKSGTFALPDTLPPI